MARKMEVLGIKISPNHEDFIVGSPDFSEFNFEVAKGSPADPLFFSSRKLQEVLLSRKKLKIGTKLGRIIFSFQTPEIVEMATYPFNKVGSEIKHLQRKGVGTGLEKKVLSLMKRKYGNLTIVPFVGTITDLREEQFIKRKLRYDREKFPAYKLKLFTLLESISSLKRRHTRSEQQKRVVRRKR